MEVTGPVGNNFLAVSSSVPARFRSHALPLVSPGEAVPMQPVRGLLHAERQLAPASSCTRGEALQVPPLQLRVPPRRGALTGHLRTAPGGSPEGGRRWAQCRGAWLPLGSPVPRTSPLGTGCTQSEYQRPPAMRSDLPTNQKDRGNVTPRSCTHTHTSPLRIF